MKPKLWNGAGIFVLIVVITVMARLWLFNGPGGWKGSTEATTASDVNAAGTLNGASGDSTANHGNSNKGAAVGIEGTGEGTGSSQSGGDGTEALPTVMETRTIPVTGNTPEYDVQAALLTDGEGRRFLRMEYYLDGSGTQAQWGEDVLPGLTGAISIYLNPKYEKVYVFIDGGTASDTWVRRSVFVLPLRDGTWKRLFSAVGKYSPLLFSPKSNYLAFSYFDPMESSVFQENSLLEIIRCETDRPVVSGSRTDTGRYIGNMADTTRVYDFEVVTWYSGTLLKLRETSWSKSVNTAEKNKLQGEYLYDVAKDAFINRTPTPTPEQGPGQETGQGDGQEAGQETGNGTGQGTGATPTPKPAEGPTALDTLTLFYSYLPSESNYPKALELLHDDFVLQLAMLKQFGVNELTKKDIDPESASLFADILKLAKLDTVIRETTEDDRAVIGYYQLFSMQEGSEVRIPIEAEFVRTGGKWRMVSAREVTEEELTQ